MSALEAVNACAVFRSQHLRQADLLWENGDRGQRGPRDIRFIQNGLDVVDMQLSRTTRRVERPTEFQCFRLGDEREEETTVPGEHDLVRWPRELVGTLQNEVRVGVMLQTSGSRGGERRALLRVDGDGQERLDLAPPPPWRRGMRVRGSAVRPAVAAARRPCGRRAPGAARSAGSASFAMTEELVVASGTPLTTQAAQVLGCCRRAFVCLPARASLRANLPGPRTSSG